MFSRRAGWDLTPNELARRVDARRRAGLAIVDLTDANPTRCGLLTPGALLAAALEALAKDPRALRYDPAPRGSAEARSAVAEYHGGRGAAVDPEAVVLTAGTSEGYAHLFRLLADPGDRVFVPQPSYPLFEFLASLEGVETDPDTLAWQPAERRFGIDLASLAAAVGPRTRALVVVSPHNPTGSVVSAAEARSLRAFCAERGLALISDEVFADFAGPAPQGAPGLLAPLGPGEAEPLTFVLSGVSKALALPQAKLAWIVAAGPRGLRDEALARLEVVADTFLSVNGPFQHLLPFLLASRGPVQQEVRERLARNRAALAEAVAPHPGVELLPSEGGWSAVLRVAPRPGASPPDEEALVLWLLERHGLLVHPGFFFELGADATGSEAAHLVVCLLADPERFVSSAHALARACGAGGIDGSLVDAATSASTPVPGGESPA